MDTLNITKIPVDPRSEHIPPPYGQGIMPIHEFTMGLVAPKGSGKTNTGGNLLRIYRGYFHNIYIFSPSIKTDEKWRYIKKMKLRIENKKLKSYIIRKNEQKENEAPVQPLPGGNAFESLVDKPFTEEIPEDCCFDVSQFGEFEKILKEKKKIIEALYDDGQFKTLADRDLFLIDDAVGSPFFTGKRLDFFKNVNTRHRHYSASIIMMTQGYKEIPKTVRINWTCLLVYPIGNMKEVEVIYEEFPINLGRDQWLELYKHATKEKFNFLFIDMYGPPEMRIRQNFNKVLQIESESDEEPAPKRRRIK